MKLNAKYLATDVSRWSYSATACARAKLRATKDMKVDVEGKIPMLGKRAQEHYLPKFHGTEKLFTVKMAE